MSIGEKIRKIRKEEGLSQEQLAEKMNVSRAAIAKWENENGIPDIENLIKLSQLFNISIDELVGNSVSNINEKSGSEDYDYHIGRKCSVDLIDWNDGIFDSYIVSQDERFYYYITIEKKRKIVGALSKQYIKKITLCSKKEKQAVDISDFNGLQSDYFLNKQVDIYLEDKHFFDGILGVDTEMLDVVIADINERFVKLIYGKEIDICKVTKIEMVIPIAKGKTILK